MNCKGCLNISKPFWADSCRVKSCVENKGLNHCGECKDIPCEILLSFSNDEEQGDKGQRIEMCKLWSKNGVEKL
jgi:hypothetical protein